MTAVLSPPPVFQFFGPNGTPLAYGKLYTYAAGTSTPIATYPSASEATPNTNPIILSSFGTGALWLDPATSYKFNLTDSLGNQIPGWPVDNITGVTAAISQVFPTTAALLSAYAANVALAYGTTVVTSARSSVGDNGGGTFWYNSTDVNSADNGGTIRVDNQGRRWYAIVDLNGINAALFGIYPNVGDISTALINALNVINGTVDLVFQVGTYTIINNDIAAATTATVIRLRGIAPAYLNTAALAGALNTYLNDGGSSFTQTPPSWVTTGYTVFLVNGTGFIGHPDAEETAYFTHDTFILENIVFWAGPDHIITVHAQPVGSRIEECTFVLSQWFGLCWRDFDQHVVRRCAFYDCGWNLALSGDLAPDYASTIVTGCAISMSGNTSPENYQNPSNIGGIGNGTQGLFDEIYIADRTYFLENLSGYAGVYINLAGDVILRRVESITGVIFTQSNVTLDNCHIESFAYQGYDGGGTDYTLYAGVFYDSSVAMLGGWGEGGFQLHYGPNAPGNPYPYQIAMSQVYTVDEVPRPAVTQFGGNPVTVGQPQRNSLGGQSLSTTAGQGDTDTFTWPAAFAIPFGYHGLVSVAVGLQSSVASVATALFLVNWSYQEPTTYGFGVVQIGSTLYGSEWPAAGYTIDVSLSVATNLGVGQNLKVAIEYAGADWTSAVGINVDVAMLGGIIPASIYST